jgi:hypothetical protein
MAPSAQATSPFMKNLPVNGLLADIRLKSHTAILFLGSLYLVTAGSQLYGKLGTDCLAKTAIQTLAAIVYLWQLVSFRPNFRAHAQDFSGAKLHAIATALAPFLIYMDLCWR